MLTVEEQPATKRVRFNPETKNNLIFSPISKPHSGGLRKKWLEYSSKCQFEQLTAEIKKYQNKGGDLEKFFHKEGEVILHWALVVESTTKAFDFITKQINKDSILSIIEDQDYNLLKIFLLGESLMEQQRDQIDKGSFKELFDKIILLLNLDPIRINSFLKTSLEQLSLEQQVNKTILDALNSFSFCNKPTCSL